jgi:hypothetical protein
MLEDDIYKKLSNYAQSTHDLGIQQDDAHVKIINLLSRQQLDISQAFQDLATNTQLWDDPTIIRAIKDIGTMRLVNRSDVSLFDSNKMEFKPEMSDYLAKYLLKRRAIYLYIFVLFQKKNHELMLMLETLDLKQEMLKQKMQSSSSSSSFSSSSPGNLAELRTSILSQLPNASTSDVEYRKTIADIFDKHIKGSKTASSSESSAIFSDLGQIIADLKKKVASYESLVKDVIPMIARWNDRTI